MAPNEFIEVLFALLHKFLDLGVCFENELRRSREFYVKI